MKFILGLTPLAEVKMLIRKKVLEESILVLSRKRELLSTWLCFYTFYLTEYRLKIWFTLLIFQLAF